VTARVLTVGETMALVDPAGPIAYGSTLTLRIAGAESNLAIALSRLGVTARWISRLGEDPLGDMIVSTLAAEGVDVSLVQRDAVAPTALFYKFRSDGKTAVHYYRRGSAATGLAPGDVPDVAFDGVELVHLTGITMGLSPSARALVADVARRAHDRGLTVIFDPNWRPRLWSDADEARSAIDAVLPYADWVLCGDQEGRELFGGATPSETIAAIRSRGAGDAVVRVGADGAQMLYEDELITIAPERVVDVVDEVGAGDAFAAGFAFGLLQGSSPVDAVRFGNRLAAAVLQGSGDWETLPSLREFAGG
jgi:2-dehydro-3-deoxygluconokinase